MQWTLTNKQNFFLPHVYGRNDDDDDDDDASCTNNRPSDLEGVHVFELHTHVH